MTNSRTVCAECGATIFADAPGGFCSVCLFRAGLACAEDENLDAVEPSIASMLKDFGDYELLEEVGRGGQGVVFRARQKSLNRTVALKVIKLGEWASKAHVRRFRLEAEAAARLEHPGIVPIHEVGERDGSCYFSMKFVEGGQLDEAARHHPMPIRRAVELIANVARTVHYAHEHGILHRDIKPGNILLDAKGKPHLTDFGLARLVESESSVTQTLDVLGTPSYMAPEQAVGNNAAISSVTDVYGLGAVLYHLLTGQPPFTAGTTYETIKLLENTEPRPPRLLNPKVDRDLSTICLKCLEKDPKRRYSSALALAEDLERWVKHEPIRARRIGLFVRGRKWVQRNPSIAVMAVLLLVLAVPLGVIVWKSGFVRSPLTTGVAVLPFENLSGDPDNAYFANGIQEEILTRLASVAGLKVISRTSTQQYQSKPRNLRDIAKQLGVANIVEGSVQKAANQMRVNVQLINAQTDSHLWADTYDRNLTDIFGVESDIAIRITRSLQAKLTGREEQALAVKPTNNPEAYDVYLRGLAFEARGISSRPNDFSFGLVKEAIGFYEQGVRLDPDFALAWARLSRAYGFLYFNGDDTKPATRGDAAKRALDKARKLEPASPDTLLALGYYQYWVLRDYGPAKNTFSLVSKMLPGSSDVLEAIARVTRREGQWEQSVASYEQALTLDPRNVEVLTHAAEMYWTLRQFPTALKLYDRALDITPKDPDIVASKAGIYQAQGNLDEAAKYLTEINAQTPSDFAVFVKRTQLRLERKYAEAIQLLQARLAQFHFASDDEKAVAQTALALMQRLAGDRAGAKITAEHARDTLQQLYGDQLNNTSDAFTAKTLSRIYAATDETDSAIKAAERAIILLPRAKDRVAGPAFEENLAFIQTISANNRSAITTLTQLLQTPYDDPITTAILRLDPIWDPLRADPAFQKLCEEKRK